MPMYLLYVFFHLFFSSSIFYATYGVSFIKYPKVIMPIYVCSFNISWYFLPLNFTFSKSNILSLFSFFLFVSIFFLYHLHKTRKFNE
jgi:hypothetical protein